MFKTSAAITLLALTALAGCGGTPEQRAANQRDIECAGATATGTLLGAALGNQVGGGSGRTVATVAGGAAGAYAGTRVGC